MSVVRIVKRVESLSHATRRISALHKCDATRCCAAKTEASGISPLTELWGDKRIYQRVEQVCCRSNLVLFAVNIDGDEPFLRIAAEGDAEVARRVFHPEIRITGPRARLDLGVREAELRDEVCDAPLTLRSLCN